MERKNTSILSKNELKKKYVDIANRIKYRLEKTLNYINTIIMTCALCDGVVQYFTSRKLYIDFRTIHKNGLDLVFLMYSRYNKEFKANIYVEASRDILVITLIRNNAQNRAELYAVNFTDSYVEIPIATDNGTIMVSVPPLMKQILNRIDDKFVTRAVRKLRKYVQDYRDLINEKIRILRQLKST